MGFLTLASRTAAHLAFLERSQWWDEARLRRLQDRLAAETVAQARAQVPHYREAYASTPPVNAVADLARLPILEKSAIKTAPGHFLPEGHDSSADWMPHTSGSTGVPIEMHYGPRDQAWQKAVALRANRAVGHRPLDRWVVFTDPRHIRKPNPVQRLGVYNPVRVSLFTPIEENMRLLERLDPCVIDTYPSYLVLLAEHARKARLPSLRRIYATAESLLPSDRARIEEGFGVPVYDQFGCVELGRTAWQCPERLGLHVDEDAVVVEILAPDGQPVAAGEGDLAYTALRNRTMPLLRYRCGDRTSWHGEACPCGRGLRPLSAVVGRRDDFLVTPDGRQLSPILLDLVVKHLQDIRQVQFIQETRTTLRALVVAPPPARPAIREALEHAVRDLFSGQVAFTIEFVDAIPRTGGKLRKVINRLPEGSR